MVEQGFELIMAEGRDPATNSFKPPLPPKDYARIEEDGLVFERDVASDCWPSGRPPASRRCLARSSLPDRIAGRP